MTERWMVTAGWAYRTIFLVLLGACWYELAGLHALHPLQQLAIAAAFWAAGDLTLRAAGIR